MVSQRLKDFMGFTDKFTDKEIDKILKDRLKLVCKPCWELKYCPYGPLVEDFPLPPSTRREHNEHNNYLQKCLDRGYMGDDDYKIPFYRGCSHQTKITLSKIITLSKQ